MGRRSIHTPEQLRELVIHSANQIVAESGLAGVSAREIARRIGYSPGTLYNLFDSLDDLILEVEALLLDSLDRRLSELPEKGTADERLIRLAHAYVSFSRENSKLWTLIVQHPIPQRSNVPAWYSERLERLVGRIEAALSNQGPLDNHPEACKRSARVIWAGLHGLTTLSTTDKLASITPGSIDPLVDDFILSYLAGLRTRSRDGRV